MTSYQMKRNDRLMRLLTFLLFSFGFVSVRGQLIEGDFRGKKFEEVVTSIESQTRYHFYYDHKLTDSLITDFEAKQSSISDVLEKIFQPVSLHYAIYGQSVYITGERKLLTDLPDNFFGQDKTKNSERIAFDYSDYEKIEKLKKLAESKLYSVGDRTSAIQGSATLAGIVRDATNGEPVIGATIFIEKLKTGVSTNQFGYYSVTIPEGRHEIKIKSMGMKTTQRQLILYSDGKLDIELDADITPLKEVVIESQHEAKVTSLNVGMEKLDIQTMKQIPLALGETDIMKVMLTLPGVQSVGEGSSGINVRGGATNQNLILLNDAVVYNPSHLFGFFSTFNPDVLKNVELYKSGIKAEYGGRLSSVLDVHTRDGNNKKISGSGGISPITGRFTLEGPLVKNKTSFIIGGRSTYSNWILHQLNDEQFRKSKASFYDVTANVSHQMNDNNSLYLSAYTSLDQFNLNNDTSYRYSDNNGSIRWKHIFNNRLYGILTGTFSKYNYTMASNKVAENAFDMDFQISQWTGKADFSYYLNPRHTLEGGLSVTNYGLQPGYIYPLHSDSEIKAMAVQREQGRESTLYISDQFEVNHKVSVYAGIRYSFYQYLGPKDVNEYSQQASREASTIIGSRTYGKGESIVAYHGLEPRVSIRYSLKDNASVKFSYNRMRQNVQMLSNTTAITPTDIWKLSDPYVKPQIGDQLSAGLYRNMKGNLIETSIETYYKFTSRTIDYKSGATLLLNEHIETDIIGAKGKAYGFELMIKKAAGKTNGWISYTYSRSLMKAAGKFLAEVVNGGVYYPSNYDKPHAANFIGNYKFSRRFNFSLNVVYSTGRPITLPIAQFELGGVNRVLYSDRNQYRIPDYFRTDVSVNIEGNHRIKKLAHSSWTFAVYNLTGRKNAYSIFFTTENGEIRSYKLSVFGQPIPTITYNFKF
jgi:hypothetical protein